MSIIINGSITATFSGKAPQNVNFSTNVPLTLPPESIGTEDHTMGLNYGADFKWDFGDGTKGFGPEISHIYLLPGIYIVSVTYDFMENNYWFGCSSGEGAFAWGWYCGELNVVTEEATILISESLKISTLDKCYRIGMNNASQGYGPSEFSGSNWPFPSPGINGRECVDENNQVHQVIFDWHSGTFREIGMVNGPDGSDLTKKFTDDDYLGVEHEISGSEEFAEITAEREHYLIEHQSTSIYMRPENEANKSQSGYDANGFRSAQQIDIDLIMDGDTASPLSTTDIPASAEVEFDKRKEMHRGRIKVSYAASEIITTGIDSYFVAKDRAATLTQRTMSENSYQDEMATDLKYWLSRDANLYKERISGATKAFGQTLTGYTGPDGRTASSFVTTPSLNISDFSLPVAAILVWARTVLTGALHEPDFIVKIGGSTISMTSINTSPSATTPWIFYYARGISNSGTINLALSLLGDPTVNLALYDVRLYNGSYPSVAAITNYYNDVVKNEGGNYLPLF